MPKKVIVMDGKRQCLKCLEWKHLKLMVVQHDTYCGRGPLCKQCHNKRNREDRTLPGYKEMANKKRRQKRLSIGLTEYSHTQNIVGNRKRCSLCKIWKRTDRFSLSFKNSSGLGCRCKECNKSEWTTYYKKHGDKVREVAIKNRPKHRDRIVKYRDKIKPKRNLAERQRAKTDIQFKLNRKMRSSMCHSLRYNGSKNGRHWEDLVGYTLTDLKKHLQKQFIDGMTWDNWGEWHIDHVIPISAFNFTDPSHTDFKRCWSLKNLQPLWAFDNLSKNDKLEKPFQPSLAL